VIRDVVFHSSPENLNDGLKAVDFVFKLAAISNAKARLFSVLIDAKAIVASTPAASWLFPVTFHLACLA
jgi:hypothetical protein